jgi:hypothetical protein
MPGKGRQTTALNKCHAGGAQNAEVLLGFNSPGQRFRRHFKKMLMNATIYGNSS